MHLRPLLIYITLKTLILLREILYIVQIGSHQTLGQIWEGSKLHNNSKDKNNLQLLKW